MREEAAGGGGEHPGLVRGEEPKGSSGRQEPGPLLSRLTLSAPSSSLEMKQTRVPRVLLSTEIPPFGTACPWQDPPAPLRLRLFYWLYPVITPWGFHNFRLW